MNHIVFILGSTPNCILCNLNQSVKIIPMRIFFWISSSPCTGADNFCFQYLWSQKAGKRKTTSLSESHFWGDKLVKVEGSETFPLSSWQRVTRLKPFTPEIRCDGRRLSCQTEDTAPRCDSPCSPILLFSSFFYELSRLQTSQHYCR